MLWLNPSMDYTAGQVLTDPQGWGSGSGLVQGGFINAPRTVDYLANVKLSLTRSFTSGPISSAELGVVRSTRNKTYDIDQAFLIFPGGAVSAPMPANAGTGGPLAWMGVGPQVTYNPLELIHNGTYQVLPTALSSIAVPPNWKVRERDVTSYVQFDLNTYLGNVSLRGNVGIQVAHTSQVSQGQRVTDHGAPAHGPDERQSGRQRRHHATGLDRSQPGLFQRVRRQCRAAADHGRELQHQLRALLFRWQQLQLQCRGREKLGVVRWWWRLRGGVGVFSEAERLHQSERGVSVRLQGFCRLLPDVRAAGAAGHHHGHRLGAGQRRPRLRQGGAGHAEPAVQPAHAGAERVRHHPDRQPHQELAGVWR